MYNYSYNQTNPSISRLDELLNRNEVIYQNLKEKLDGINRSSSNIHRNIHHLSSSFHSFSQESSAIEKEIPLKSNYNYKPPDIFKPSFEGGHLRNRMERNAKDQKGAIGEYSRQAFLRSKNSYNTYESNSEDKVEQKEVTFSEDTNRHIDQYNMIIQERIIQERIRQEKERIMGQQRRYNQRLMEEQREARIREEKIRLMREEERLARVRQEEERLRELELQLLQEKHLQAQRLAIRVGGKRDNSLKSDRKQRELGQDALIGRSSNLSWNGSASRDHFQGMRLNRVSTEQGLRQLQKQVKPLKTNMIYLQSNSKLQEDSKLEAEQIPTFRKVYQTEEVVKQEPPRSSERDKFTVADKMAGQQDFSSSLETHQRSNTRPANSQIFSPSKTISFFQKLANSQQIHNITAKEEDFDATERTRQMEEDFGGPQCILFAPFNKVFRSPIVQFKKGTVILERKSKTGITSSNKGRILDGIKYRVKNIIIEEQQLLKELFRVQGKSQKIGIVGGRETLKKKLHMSLLAQVSDYLTKIISSSHSFLMCNLEHQEVNSPASPLCLQLCIPIEPSERRIATLKLHKSLQQVYKIIGRNSGGARGTAPRKILRMTKVLLLSGKNVIWSIDIISSNHYNFQFLQYLKVDRLCWCINPLIKYYDQVKDTLDSLRIYTQTRKTK